MTPAAIEVRDLRYSYADGTEALRGVSFRIESGECLGLIGPNGAGKSTLLLHLNGLLPEEPASESSVFIDGRPITAANLAEMRRHVGLLFSDSNDQIFCPTVFDDVAFGPQQLGLDDGQVRTRVTECLAKVGLSGFENRAPHRLSTGEKRRVCLAGLLACDPGVLVLDEPTAGLDPKGRRELKQLLSQLNITKIIATHDLEMVVELCPRVVLLGQGRVITSGPTRELLSNEQLMLEYDLERPHILQHLHPHPLMPTVVLPMHKNEK